MQPRVERRRVCGKRGNGWGRRGLTGSEIFSDASSAVAFFFFRRRRGICGLLGVWACCMREIFLLPWRVGRLGGQAPRNGIDDAGMLFFGGGGNISWEDRPWAGWEILGFGVHAWAIWILFFLQIGLQSKSIDQELNMLSVFSPVVWGSFLELDVPITCTIYLLIPHITHSQENPKILLTHHTYRPV